MYNKPNQTSDREEATKDGDFTLNEDDDEDDEQEEWEVDATWTNDGDEGEGDVKDESAAYLEFLNEEVIIQASLSLRVC